MSEAELSARLLAALKACANDSAGAEAPLVSMTTEFLREDMAAASVTAEIARKTRTLIFATAEARGADGAPVATASSVHRIKP